MFFLNELGQRLKQARQEKKLSLEELQNITKIQKRYLQNIEDGNYDALPGLFYARAFVKQYAEAVGLDAEMVFEEYKNDIPTTHKEAIPEQLSRVKRIRAEVNTTDNKVFRVLPKILVTVVLIGIAVTVWTILQNNSMDQVEEQEETEIDSELEKSSENPLQTTSPNEDGDNQEEATTVTEVKKNDPPPAEEEAKPSQQIQLVESSGRKSTYKLSNTSQFIVEVTTTGETWLDLKNGKKKTFFSGMLNTKEEDAVPNNASYDYTNETDAFIKLGRAIDSIVKINGQVLELPKEPKSVQEITILFEKNIEQ